MEQGQPITALLLIMTITVYNPNKFGDTRKKMSIKEFREYFEEERNSELKELVFKSLKKNFSKIEPDGHGIYYAKYYLVDLELPEDVVLPLVQKHLSMLYKLCDLLDATDYDSKHGRGAQAAQLVSALHKKLNIKSE